MRQESEKNLESEEIFRENAKFFSESLFRNINTYPTLSDPERLTVNRCMPSVNS